MFEYEVLRDMGIVLAGIVALSILFYKFDRHQPIWRILLRPLIIFLLLFFLRFSLGGLALWVAVVILLIRQIALHAWWYPKNGINGLTAEPYDQYMDLVKRMKNK